MARRVRTGEPRRWRRPAISAGHTQMMRRPAKAARSSGHEPRMQRVRVAGGRWGIAMWATPSGEAATLQQFRRPRQTPRAVFGRLGVATTAQLGKRSGGFDSTHMGRCPHGDAPATGGVTGASRPSLGRGSTGQIEQPPGFVSRTSPRRSPPVATGRALPETWRAPRSRSGALLSAIYSCERHPATAWGKVAGCGHPLGGTWAPAYDGTSRSTPRRHHIRAVPQVITMPAGSRVLAGEAAVACTAAPDVKAACASTCHTPRT
jgi:hypothetical protein